MADHVQHHAYITLASDPDKPQFIAGGSKEYCEQAVENYLKDYPKDSGYVRPCTESELK